jgi:dihydroflavonol-4-reductase
MLKSSSMIALSAFPSTVPKDENELIAPARDGALRVLKAARDAGVKRCSTVSQPAAASAQPGWC